MATEWREINVIEDMMLHFRGIRDQAKEALENHDQATAERLIEEANQIANDLQILRRYKELGQKDLDLDRTRSADLREITEDWKRAENQIGQLTTSALQYMQRMRAENRAIRRELTQVALELESVKHTSTISISRQLEEVALALDRLKDKMTSSMSEVDGDETCQPWSQGYGAGGLDRTSTNPNGHPLKSSGAVLGVLPGLQYPPGWLGDDGFEELTRQWLETDDNGRQRIADLQNCMIMVSPSNKTHAMRSRAPNLSCACRTECWMSGIDEPVEKIPGEVFCEKSTEELFNYQYRLYTANTRRDFAQWEQEVGCGKTLSREHELCWKDIVWLAEGKSKNDDIDGPQEWKLDPEQEQDRRVNSTWNYCYWIRQHPGFEIDLQVFEAAQRLLGLVKNQESLEGADAVPETNLASENAEAPPPEKPKVTLTYIVKNGDETIERVEQVLSTVEQNDDGNFCCFNNLDTPGDVLPDIKGRIICHAEFVRCEEAWLDTLPNARDEKRRNPWVIFDHAVKNVGDDGRTLNRQVLCPDHFMRSSDGKVSGISARRLNDGAWATNSVERQPDGSILCITEIRSLSGGNVKGVVG